MDDHDWDDPLVHVVNSILTSKSNGRPVLYRLGPAGLTILHQPSGRWIEVEPNAAPAHPRLAPGIVVIGRADNSLIALDLEAAHLVRMDSRLVRQRLLTQVPLFTALPNFFAKASQDRLCGHTQGSIRDEHNVQTL